MVPCRSRWSGVTLSRMPTVGSSVGVSSIWKEDISIDVEAVRRRAAPAPGWRCRCCRPSARRVPACRRMCAISAVVVDLPLVPVMATNGASGALLARSRANSSMSPMISTPAALALCTVQCGSGCVSGTPGASTSAANRLQSAVARSSTAKPARRRRLAARHAVVGRHHRRAAGRQRAAAREPRHAEPEHGNRSPGEGGDGASWSH